MRTMLRTFAVVAWSSDVVADTAWANGAKLTDGSVGPVYEPTVTTNDCVTVVPVVGSVAVTVMVDVSPAVALLVLSNSDPLGLPSASETDVKTGL